MTLQSIREQLDMLDSAIKNLLVFRMALIPLVAEIKLKDNLPMFQPEREKHMYQNIERFCEEKGINGELVKGIYQLIIAEALRIEHNIEDNNLQYDSAVKIQDNENEKLRANFEMLESLLNFDLKNITNDLEQIVKSQNTDAKNISELASSYYRKKLI